MHKLTIWKGICSTKGLNELKKNVNNSNCITYNETDSEIVFEYVELNDNFRDILKKYKLGAFCIYGG